MVNAQVRQSLVDVATRFPEQPDRLGDDRVGSTRHRLRFGDETSGGVEDPVDPALAERAYSNPRNALIGLIQQ